MSEAALPSPARPMSRPLYEEKGPIVLVGFFAMVFGMFMAVLDIQIVSSSLSQIQAGLSASASEVSWVQTSYLIAEVVMIPLSGYLSRMMSTRLLFTISAAGFTLSSLACGLATSLEEMIFWRAIQGFVGGAMIPTVFATSYIIFGASRRGLSSAFVGLVVTLAPTIGPTLGGYITELVSWHWLFFVNIVPGIIVATTVWLTMDIDKPDWRLWKNLDVEGLILLALFLGTFQYVLEEGSKNDWFQDSEIRTLTLISLISGTLFLWRTLTSKNPIVDFSPLATKGFAIGAAMAFAVGMALFGVMFLLPIYLGRVQQLSSMQIGDWLWVGGFFSFISAPVVGILAGKVDLRYMCAAGFAMLALSVLQFSSLTSESGFWDLFWPQALRGVGLMAAMMAVQSMAIQSLKPEQVRGASGLFNLFRNTGGAFGLAILNTQLSARIDHHWLRLREGLDAGNAQAQAFLEGFAARYETMYPGDSAMAALKILGQVTFQQASVLAFNDLFLMLSVAFIAAALLLFVIDKPVNRLAQEMD